MPSLNCYAWGISVPHRPSMSSMPPGNDQHVIWITHFDIFDPSIQDEIGKKSSLGNALLPSFPILLSVSNAPSFGWYSLAFDWTLQYQARCLCFRKIRSNCYLVLQHLLNYYGNPEGSKVLSTSETWCECSVTNPVDVYLFLSLTFIR